MERKRGRVHRGPHGQGDQPPQDTRARILAASLDLFAERGFEGTGISEIAERVGIAKSVIYYHFRNKEAVLAEISRSTIAAALLLKRDIAERLGTVFGGGRDLSGVVDALVSFVLSNRTAMVVLLRESLRGGPNPPLFEFWESNLRLGSELADRTGVDLDGARAREVLFEAFFMLVLPIVGFAVLGDQWAARFGLEPRQLRRTFEKVFRANLEELWFDRLVTVRGGSAARGR